MTPERLAELKQDAEWYADHYPAEMSRSLTNRELADVVAAAERLAALEAAARKVLQTPHKEAEMRRDYPTGSCNAEDARKEFLDATACDVNALAALLPKEKT